MTELNETILISLSFFALFFLPCFALLLCNDGKNRTNFYVDDRVEYYDDFRKRTRRGIVIDRKTGSSGIYKYLVVFQDKKREWKYGYNIYPCSSDK